MSLIIFETTIFNEQCGWKHFLTGYNFLLTSSTNDLAHVNFFLGWSFQNSRKIIPKNGFLETPIILNSPPETTSEVNDRSKISSKKNIRQEKKNVHVIVKLI